MSVFIMILELLVVLGAITMGTRSSGVALGLWGGVGVAVLVFVFREPVGSPPVDALLIVLAVVLASSTMQVAGGIDWLVSVAARMIARHPGQITIVAPLVTFVFAVGAGTANILYPLLPLIYNLAYRNGVRPSRPLSMSVIAASVALGCSPVSAAMALMVTLTDKAPYGFGLAHILMVTVPAAIVGLVVSSLVVSRLGRDLDKDPEIAARVADGTLPAPGGPTVLTVDLAPDVTVTRSGRRAALVFLAGVVLIVVFGLVKAIRPVASDGSPVSMTPVIGMIMFVAGAIILLLCRPQVADIPTSSVFRAGTVSAIALFGLAWLTDTYLTAHSAAIVGGVGSLVRGAPWVFAIGVFVVCMLTTSQSTATRALVPIGLAAGIPPALLAGFWVGGMPGTYVLPTNGSQIAAANFDRSGTTRLGTRLYDHSFFVPALVLGLTSAIAGGLMGLVVQG